MRGRRARGHFVCYTGFENLLDELPDDVDLVFIGAFTEAAFLAYALSNLFRSRGAVTVLGGPARALLPGGRAEVLRLRRRLHRPGRDPRGAARTARRTGRCGVQLAAKRQPTTLPGVRERWKFIEPTLAKGARSQDRPDAREPRLPLHVQLLHRLRRALPAARLRGAEARTCGSSCGSSSGRASAGTTRTSASASTTTWTRSRRPCRPDRIDFIAESSLSLLSEPHLKRLERSGFKALLPGVESWYDLGNKSKTGRLKGMDKVRQVSEHVNMILRYIPYVQTNFVLGLDSDAGDEPFELTKRFVDLTPGRLPRLLAPLGVRAGRARSTSSTSARPRAAVPLPLPGQQPRDEREAAELLVARLLRPRHRSDQLHVLLARPSSAASGEPEE